MLAGVTITSALGAAHVGQFFGFANVDIEILRAVVLTDDRARVHTGSGCDEKYTTVLSSTEGIGCDHAFPRQQVRRYVDERCHRTMDGNP